MSKDAGIVRLAEVMTETNEVQRDISWVRSNQLTSNIHYKRTVMPTAQSRQLNEGISSSVSKKEAHTDTCVQVATRSDVDIALLDIAPDPAEFLAQEARPHMTALAEMTVHGIFKGDVEGGILGFETRLNKLNLPGNKKNQIVDAGGTGQNLGSIYIIKWDPDEVTGIYPMNTTAGLNIEILAKHMVDDKAGKKFIAHTTEFSQFYGLSVRDYRYVSRLCNIDLDLVLNDQAAQVNLFNKLITAKNRIYNVSSGHVFMYMSPELANLIEIAGWNKTNALIGYREDIQNDTRILSFSGIPIRKNDFMSDPETQVV
jgi:hypothetical protein